MARTFLALLFAISLENGARAEEPETNQSVPTASQSRETAPQSRPPETQPWVRSGKEAIARWNQEDRAASAAEDSRPSCAAVPGGGVKHSSNSALLIFASALTAYHLLHRKNKPVV